MISLPPYNSRKINLYLLGSVGFVTLLILKSIIKLPWKDLVSDLILIWTAIVIIWYTLETSDLKKTSAKQVDVQEDIMMNEFIPIVVPDYELGSGRIILEQGEIKNLTLRNFGKGIAQRVEISSAGVTVWKNSDIAPNEPPRPVVVSADFHDHLKKLREEKKDTHNFEIRYVDIFDRPFRTFLFIDYDEEDESRGGNRFNFSHYKFLRPGQHL